MDAAIKDMLDSSNPMASFAAIDLLDVPSVLECRLLRLCALGVISSNMVASLAEGAVLDGLSHERVKRLARAGASGLYPGNVRRDIFRSVRADYLIQAPESVELYMNIGKGKVGVFHHAILPPAAIVDALYRKSRHTFDELVVGSAPREFWSKVRPTDPKLAALGDMLRMPNWQDYAIPYVLHGDKAQFTIKNHRSLWCLQWKSLLGRKFGAGTCLITSVVAHTLLKEPFDAWDDLWKAIVKYLNDFYHGEYKGKRICDGYFFVCWGLSGDLEYLCNEYKIAHFNSNDPCNFCACDRGARPCSAVGPEAPWLPTVYRLDSVPLVPSEDAIWKTHGVRRFHISLDLMHCGNSGVMSFLLASVLSELIDNSGFGGGKAQRVDAMWSLIAAAYDSLGITKSRITCLDEAMLGKPGEYASLPTKAAENRHLLPALLHVCRQLSKGTESELIRVAALESLDKLYCVFEKAGMFLNDSEYILAKRYLENFSLAYNWLANRAAEQGFLRYHLTIKLHMMFHIVDMSQYLNPRFLWCFSFEDYMGAVVQSARACVASTAMHKIGHKIMDNMLLLLHVMLELGDMWLRQL